MKRRYSRSQLTNGSLFTVVTNRLALDRETTADLLADLAEIDKRRMYAEAGYDSMKLYCVHVLKMSEDVAYKRVRAALAARKFPVILPRAGGWQGAPGRRRRAGAALHGEECRRVARRRDTSDDGCSRAAGRRALPQARHAVARAGDLRSGCEPRTGRAGSGPLGRAEWIEISWSHWPCGQRTQLFRRIRRCRWCQFRSSPSSRHCRQVASRCSTR